MPLISNNIYHPDRAAKPTIKDFDALQILHPEEIKLSNGVKIVNLDMGEQPVCRITVRWDVGLCESDSQEALVLMYKMLREGTNNHTGDEISNILEFNGAWMNQSVDSHSGSVSLYTLNSRFDDVFPVFMDIITSANFPENAVSSIGERCAATLELQQAKVAWQSSRLDTERIFGKGHPLSVRQSPTKFRQISSSCLKDLFNLSILSIPPTVYVAGKTKDILDKIIAYFERFVYTPNTFIHNIIPAKPENAKLASIYINDSLQSAINLSIPTIRRDNPEYINLRLATIGLGGYFGSRLMKNIREDKGWTYGIQGNLLGYKEIGVVNISTQTDNKYVDPVIAEILKEIERLKTDPLTEDEIRSLRQYALSGLASILDSPFSVIEHFISIDSNGSSPSYFEQQLDAIKSLSAETICNVAQKYMPTENALISIAGKYKSNPENL